MVIIMITNPENNLHLLVIDTGERISEINGYINKANNITVKTIFTDSYHRVNEIISNTKVDFLLVTKGLWRRDEIGTVLDRIKSKNSSVIVIAECAFKQIDYDINFSNIIYIEQLTPSKLNKLLTRPAIKDTRTNAINTVQNENLLISKHKGLYDSLTGLPNRELLVNSLQEKIDKHSDTDPKIGVLFLDLDDFKAINDVAGHDVGDKVLKEVALRIEKNTRVSDLSARQGGDEFIILLSRIKDIESAESVAENILTSLSKPICIDDECWNITTSIGISIFPHDGDTPEKLLKHADAAMYNAKQAGKNTIKYFNRELGRELDKKYEIIQEVKKSIENDDFSIELQPQYNLKNDDIIGVELFIRWMHPDRGKLLPDDFLPYIQNTNYISHIGDIVLNKAVMLSQELKSLGLNNIQIAINVEARQLINDSFIKKLEETMQNHSILKSLIIEIDESSFLSNYKSASKRLQRLKSLGVTICLDNVGYGTSSLMPIVDLPIDIMKFDNKMSFGNGFDDAVKRIIIFAAHALGKKVMAKRISDTSELKKLIDFGCDYGQGYCFEKMDKTSTVYNNIKNIKVG